MEIRGLCAMNGYERLDAPPGCRRTFIDANEAGVVSLLKNMRRVDPALSTRRMGSRPSRFDPDWK